MNKTGKLKVGIIGTVGIPAKYGGFETLAEHLVDKKADDFEFIVYCSKKAYSKKRIPHKKANLKYLPLNANGVQSIPYDILSILHSLYKVDKLLILGVSGCMILPIVKLFSRKKIIVNIDGLEWKREKWGYFAKKYLKISEKLAVNYANVVIADNRVIQEHVKNSYRKNAKLIAYGADHTKAQPISPETIREFPFLKDPYVFKVCRIEPENNIELILKAFTKYPNINLVIIGNWENSTYSKRLKSDYGNTENIFLLNPIYDQKKLNEIRSNCHLYIHGHSAGGTNPSLVEAMHLGLAILAYGVDYNRETTLNKALYFIDQESIIKEIEGSDPQILAKVGENMKKIAQQYYTWDYVSNEYERLFLN